MRFPLGSQCHLVFYDLTTDSYVPKGGIVTGVRGTEVQIRGLKGWHATEEWPPGFGTREECLEWIGAHPFRAPEIK